MAKMKDHMMKIEELVWEAIENGCQTDDEIFAFVSMLDDNISKDMIEYVAQKIEEDWAREDYEYNLIDPDWDRFDVRQIIFH